MNQVSIGHRLVPAMLVRSMRDTLAFYEKLGFEAAGDRFFHYENGPSLPMCIDVTKHAARLARERRRREARA